jgi:hypothetical protein
MLIRRFVALPHPTPWLLVSHVYPNCLLRVAGGPMAQRNVPALNAETGLVLTHLARAEASKLCFRKAGAVLS